MTEIQHGAFDRILELAEGVILGKHNEIKLALCTLLARGHLLIEDLPGVGKTTLAHTLATLLGLKYQRIQFTSDLLPADILGVRVYDRQAEQFSFHPGPVFSQVILADEINRATPKTQSALLEAMEEEQVTVEGESHPLPHPFFVIATQNPSHQVGTFPLPESQFDRFLMRIRLGYPDPAHERLLLKGQGGRPRLAALQAGATPEALAAWQGEVSRIHVADALIDYLQALVAETRSHRLLAHGLSPRAAQGLLQAARAWAWIHGRREVHPDDLQAVWPSVAAHRLITAGGADADTLADEMLRQVAIP